MKVSKESMEKLGFKNHKGYWQHERVRDLCFYELPEWHKIVHNSFIAGSRHAREEEALGIQL
tara:strand:+ start:443 stop:628 length:186 start_codon:yes stop_codon:yes gene_type:complete